MNNTQKIILAFALGILIGSFSVMSQFTEYGIENYKECVKYE